MESTRFIPENPERIEWDVVIVGTGMGGSTIGHALAKRGRQVLFLEKGQFLFDGTHRSDGRIPTNPDQSVEGRLRGGWWPHQINGETSLGSLEFWPAMGCGTGGTSVLYAAQLERFQPHDFRPRGQHASAHESTVPEAWPISYQDLLPYYRQAEKLYNVCGTPDPLDPDPESPLRAPPPLSPRDQDLYDSFEELGLHPYRAHVGYDFSEGCIECGGAMCPRRCKRDAGSTCLLPALEQHGAKILPECEVLRLDAEPSRVTRVIVRRNGQELSIAASTVILSAGAFMSPVILLRSTSSAWPDGIGNRTGLVGRNLMVHASDYVAVRPRRPASSEGPKKAIALNDFYVHEGRKLGTFQSVGLPVTAGNVAYYLRNQLKRTPSLLQSLAKPAILGLAYAGASYYEDATLFATILEDLPYHENRVIPDSRNPSGFRFEYRYPQELRERTRFFRKTLTGRLTPHKLVVVSGENNLNFGHLCGTCRFGLDPASSVLDPDNRVHGMDNLYVVDASFFPSSSGTNPSLTIAANALRVAAAI